MPATLPASFPWMAPSWSSLQAAMEPSAKRSTGCCRRAAPPALRPSWPSCQSGQARDFARGVGLVADIDRLAARIVGGDKRSIDAGCVNYVGDDGALASRHFINIASLGLSGPTDRAVNAAKSGGRFSGRLVFLFHTVREMLRYKFQNVRITVDDGKPIEARIALVAIANAPYFGGGMKIAPDAVPDDGLFEVVIVRGVSKFSLLKDLAAGLQRQRTSRCRPARSCAARRSWSSRSAVPWPTPHCSTSMASRRAASPQPSRSSPARSRCAAEWRTRADRNRSPTPQGNSGSCAICRCRSLPL